MKRDAISASGCGSAFGATGLIQIDGNNVSNLEDKSLTAAETLALQAVAFIFADDDLTSAFIAVTGADPQEIREHLSEAGNLAGVLEFLLGREDQLIEFCEQFDIEPNQPARAFHRLSGTPADGFI